MSSPSNTSTTSMPQQVQQTDDITTRSDCRDSESSHSDEVSGPLPPAGLSLTEDQAKRRTQDQSTLQSTSNRSTLFEDARESQRQSITPPQDNIIFPAQALHEEGLEDALPLRPDHESMPPSPLEGALDMVQDSSRAGSSSSSVTPSGIDDECDINLQEGPPANDVHESIDHDQGSKNEGQGRIEEILEEPSGQTQRQAQGGSGSEFYGNNTSLDQNIGDLNPIQETSSVGSKDASHSPATERQMSLRSKLSLIDNIFGQLDTDYPGSSSETPSPPGSSTSNTSNTSPCTEAYKDFTKADSAEETTIRKRIPREDILSLAPNNVPISDLDTTSDVQSDSSPKIKDAKPSLGNVGPPKGTIPGTASFQHEEDRVPLHSKRIPWPEHEFDQMLVFERHALRCFSVTFPLTSSKGMHKGGRCTIIMLQTGRLVVWSPCPLTSNVLNLINIWGGNVILVVCPNNKHYLFAARWQRVFPRANFAFTKKIIKKLSVGREKLRGEAWLEPLGASIRYLLNDEIAMTEVVNEFEFETTSLQEYDETIAFWKPAGIMLAADILHNYPHTHAYLHTPKQSFKGRFLANVFYPSRIGNWFTHVHNWKQNALKGSKDQRDRWRVSLKKVLEHWPVSVIIPCHGNIVNQFAAELLHDLFYRYLQPGLSNWAAKKPELRDIATEEDESRCYKNERQRIEKLLPNDPYVMMRQHKGRYKKEGEWRFPPPRAVIWPWSPAKRWPNPLTDKYWESFSPDVPPITCCFLECQTPRHGPPTVDRDMEFEVTQLLNAFHLLGGRPRNPDINRVITLERQAALRAEHQVENLAEYRAEPGTIGDIMVVPETATFFAEHEMAVNLGEPDIAREFTGVPETPMFWGRAVPEHDRRPLAGAEDHPGDRLNDDEVESEEGLEEQPAVNGEEIHNSGREAVETQARLLLNPFRAQRIPTNQSPDRFRSTANCKSSRLSTIPESPHESIADSLAMART